ncbi:12567_t:CDS:2 [Ambispora leptoticha]|uniref:12567_t:CDS:1 n=1 Tax=Ambispora leptoticha TaxID=144679 RepID=A0A9N8Z308_9GLOM|nr:12567_t:CDS:2 [Ambispora leptoticha]
MTPKQYSKGLSYVKKVPRFLEGLIDNDSAQRKFNSDEDDYDIVPQNQSNEEEEGIELINSHDEEKPQIVVLREGKHMSEEQVKDYLEQKLSTKKESDFTDDIESKTSDKGDKKDKKLKVGKTKAKSTKKLLSFNADDDDGTNYEVIPSNFPETLDKQKYTPEEYVIANAIEKGKDVYTRLTTQPSSSSSRPDLIISADTVVVYENQTLEKPESPEHAFEILKSLNGNTHDVFTGVALIYPLSNNDGDNIKSKNNQLDYNIRTFVENTKVTFRNTSDEFFRAYIETGEPMDKAGKLSLVSAYGYQGIAAHFVEKIDGCYYNVIGLPTRLFIVLQELVNKGDI